MQVFQGIPAASGMASGPAFILQEQVLDLEEKEIDDPDHEWERLERALSSAIEELTTILHKAEAETGQEEAAIFDAHRMFLQDPQLLKTTRNAIDEQKLNAEAAWSQAFEGYARTMEAMEDEYFRARAKDIRDVGRRVLRLLLGLEEQDLSELALPSVIIARDLSPSDTIRLDKHLVLAFSTAEGGATSHTAILAKALGLPAVVGVGKAILDIPSEAPLLVDGERGLVISNPDQAAREEFESRRREYQLRIQAELQDAHMPASTTDGHMVEIVANIGSPDEAEIALQYGAEGIGLLRTEFLYLDRQIAPDEGEQLQAYNAILDTMVEKPVVIRTLDVGGDKELPYLDLGREANPFLGWRAIRMCLDQPEFFKVQLRALLRASPGHDVRIMFPMIATIEEVHRSRALLNEARNEVESMGYPVSERIQIGIMVEVPSVAVLADRFSQEVDFFSIGTNDLTQYTLAAERTNEKVAHLGDACHPAILRQIEHVIEAAHAQGIWVGLCGELAGDPDAIPILLGLDLDEFSMAPSSIPRAKTIIRRWSLSEAQRLAAKSLDLDSANEVRELVRQQEPS